MCNIAGQICRKSTHFPSVKFPGLKMCECKKMTNIRYADASKIFNFVYIFNAWCFQDLLSYLYFKHLMLPSSLFYFYFKHLNLPRSYLMLMLLAEVTDGFRPRQNLFNQNNQERNWDCSHLFFWLSACTSRKSPLQLLPFPRQAFNPEISTRLPF